MLFQKMRFLLFLSIVWLGLSSCSSGSGENDVNGLPEAPEDTVNPGVTETYPEQDQEDVDVKESVRVVFSELMDEASILAGGIQLFSGRLDETTGKIEEQRDAYMAFSQIPGVGFHPVTGEKQDILVSVVNLQAAKKRFALGNSYTVRVFDTAKDLANNPKKEDANGSEGEEAESSDIDLKDTIIKVSFFVEDGVWQEAHLLETDIPDPVDASSPPVAISGDVFDPKLAVNNEGDTIAVWRQAEVKNGVTRILASRYSPDDGTWGSVETQSIHTASSNFIDQDLETSAFSPEIAINKDGVAAVVWQQSPVIADVSSIYINVFDCGGWLGPVNILAGKQLEDETANSPKVVIDDSGKIIVAWRELDKSDNNGYYRIKTAVYQIDRAVDPDGLKTCNAVGLAEETTLEQDAPGSAGAPKLKISSKGSAFLVWPQMIANTYQQIYASRYIKDSGWSEAKRLDSTTLASDKQGDASAPDVAIDENNDAFAIWQQYDGKRENIWVNRYAAGVWGIAKLLETDNRGDAIAPHISFSKRNKAFAVWQQKQGNSPVLNLKSFTSDAGWSAVEPLATSNTGLFSRPAVKFDREGNAMVMWVQGSTASGTVAASRYSKEEEKWQLAQGMNTKAWNSQGLVFEPLLEDGRMLALWYHNDGAGFRLGSALFSE